MPADYEANIKSRYAELREAELDAFAGFLLTDFDILRPPKPSEYPDARPALAATPEERRAEYEFRWKSGGLCFYNSYTDLLFSEEANATLQEFIGEKIHEIVHDPEVAELLIPKDHAILAKRLCGENGYYEAFNRDNVTLVDVRSDAIAEFTAGGLRLASGEEHAFDAIICATGYDAGTGAMLRMDVRGRGGRTLKEHWADGTRTHLGLMCHGFPNLFLLDGPQSPSAFFAPIILNQFQAGWVGRLLDRLDGDGAQVVEPTLEAEAAWSALVQEIANATLLVKANSQYMGANIPGKPRECLYFLGGYREYARRCDLALEPETGELVSTSAAASATS
jgi:cyclohexanone monooxygenase